MPSNNTLGQQPRAKLDNCGSQYANEGEPPKVATATSQSPQWHNLPAEMRERRQWMMAGPDKQGVNKVPVSLDGSPASYTNPICWSNFETICAEAAKRGYGVGYVIDENDPYTCIDLDIKGEGDFDKDGKPLPPDAARDGQCVQSVG
jgi:hypothetical protein